MTSEFNHYHGCRGKDPDNCSGCVSGVPTPENGMRLPDRESR